MIYDKYSWPITWASGRVFGPRNGSALIKNIAQGAV